jgi:hypothetical protein
MSSDPPKVEYPTSQDRPDLTTGDGHTVGIDRNAGCGFVDTTTGQPINTSDTHTKFGGSSDYNDGDDGGFVEEIIDAVTDACVLM